MNDLLSNNVPEFSVSEISHALKNMVEDNFAHVRVRGELSRVTIAKSGHMYSSLKDDQAVLDAVCWKGTVGRLSLKPEEGLEVIVTGRLTTYPGRSNYQIVIESMELAGEGALLKMLEERRKKLAAEGLFDETRKKPLPFLPNRVGVVTSPTGAVIRDILHRLQDRFPRPVLLWPVMVQGQGAAEQITQAIEGFNQLPVGQRPDVIIVARGGGSLEDLMPFQEEMVIRAVAQSTLPVISAVGHETDTTLIDYAADYRAPTPTAAAEKVVPVRQDIMGWLINQQERLTHILRKNLEYHETCLSGLSRGLPHPRRYLETMIQKVDFVDTQLGKTLQTVLDKKEKQITVSGTQLRHPDQFITLAEQRLKGASQLLESLSFKSVLARGYAVIRDSEDQPILKTADLPSDFTIEMQDGKKAAQTKP